MVRAVFATLAMDKEGNTAACYFALTKDQPHKLIIPDFETSRYETHIFELMTERLEQLAEVLQCPSMSDLYGQGPCQGSGAARLPRP